MKDVKVVFLQTKKEDLHALSELLGHLLTKEYFFVLVPHSVKVRVKVLSKKEVLQMLSACTD